MIKKLIYAGTFDPITFGHIDIIERAMHICDVLVVAVALQQKKNPRLDFAVRYDLAKRVCAPYGARVEVCSFSGLLTDFAKKKGICTLLRGIRSNSDFAYEMQMAVANRMLEEKMETIFMISSAKYMGISSSLVREIDYFGGDLTSFVPQEVIKVLLGK